MTPDWCYDPDGDNDEDAPPPHLAEQVSAAGSEESESAGDDE